MRLFLLSVLFVVTSSAQTVTVTLVGTGGPELTPRRSGIATAITSEGHTILIDAGRNTLTNLYRARIDPASITTIVLTHLHSDHIDGLPDLWITPWFLLHRTTPLTVYGPPGTQQMIDGMRSMYAHDIAARANPSAPAAALAITVHELHDCDQADLFPGLHLTATTVEHADGNPALAYRFATSDHSVFLTGDCTLTPALIAAAAHADVLIANVALGSPQQEALPKWKPVFAKLLTPEQAAQLFATAQPRLAVYSHIVTKGVQPRDEDNLIRQRTRRAGYAGRLLVGSDGQQIAVAANLRIRRIAPPSVPLDGSR
jgi:ribonuclease Z